MKQIKKIEVIILVLTSVFLISFFLINKTSKSNLNNSKTVLEIVENIRKEIIAIDSEKNYEIRVLNNEEFLGHMTDGGGQLTGSLKDGKVFKIVEKLGLSYGVITYEYYFYNEKLLLVKEKEEGFPDPDNTGALDYSKVETAFNGEYFFNEGKVVYLQTKGQKRFSDKTFEQDNRFMQMALENIQLLKNKK